MSRAALATAAWIGLMLAPALGQDQVDALAQCRAVTDSLQRLTCYDAIELPDDSVPVVKGEGFQVIDLDILKVDKETMTGDAVEVSGTIMQMGELIMLTNGQMDSNPIMVDAAAVPRAQKLEIVQRCNMGCRATVRGEVGSVFFQAGIIASAIETN